MAIARPGAPFLPMPAESGTRTTLIMMIKQTHRVLRHPLTALLVLLPLLALGIEGATIPHAHRSLGPGLFNEEHDLTNLATSRGGVTVPAAMPAVNVLVVITPLSLGAAARTAATPCRQFDSRAPPSSLA